MGGGPVESDASRYGCPAEEPTGGVAEGIADEYRTADALVGLSHLIDAHGTTSPQVEAFVAENAGLPEFPAMAAECLRLASLYGPIRRDLGAPLERLKKARKADRARRMAAAVLLAVGAIGLAATGSGLYTHARSQEKELADVRRQLDESERSRFASLWAPRDGLRITGPAIRDLGKLVRSDPRGLESLAMAGLPDLGKAGTIDVGMLENWSRRGRAISVSVTLVRQASGLMIDRLSLLGCAGIGGRKEAAAIAANAGQLAVDTLIRVRELSPPAPIEGLEERIRAAQSLHAAVDATPATTRAAGHAASPEAEGRSAAGILTVFAARCNHRAERLRSEDRATTSQEEREELELFRRQLLDLASASTRAAESLADSKQLAALAADAARLLQEPRTAPKSAPSQGERPPLGPSDPTGDGGAGSQPKPGPRNLAEVPGERPKLEVFAKPDAPRSEIELMTPTGGFPRAVAPAPASAAPK